MTGERMDFEVQGIPVPQGSKRMGKHGTRFVILDDNDRALKPWRRTVAWAATHAKRPAQWELCDGPVALTLVFYMPKPPSVKRATAHVKPDLSKLVRAVEDSLTEAGVWVDDSRVTECHATKHYADAAHPPGVHVSVRRLP